MREMVKLFAVVLIFSACSGLTLAAVYTGTRTRIEYQQLKFVKGPALRQILEGCANDPLTDRFKLADGKHARTFFVGVFDGKPNTVALEGFGTGFAGDIGVLVAVNIETDQIVGVGVTTHTETPGVGSRAKTDPSFSAQFKGLSIKQPFKVKADGGQIDALSGATYSSRGVCAAVMQTSEIYQRLKPKLLEKLKAYQS